MAAKRKPATAPAPSRSLEEIALNALHEAKQDYDASLAPMAEETRQGLIATAPHAALRVHALNDATIIESTVDAFCERTPALAAVLYHEGYRQACEDMVTEMQAFLKGLN